MERGIAKFVPPAQWLRKLCSDPSKIGVCRGLAMIAQFRWVAVAAVAAPANPGRPVTLQKGKVVDSSTSKKSAVLDRLRDKHRPVVVFGPKPDDAKFVKQSHSWLGALPEAGIKDRDIVVVEVPAQGEGKVGGETLKPEEARELRSAFSVADDAFAVILIGRDGSEKA